MGLAPQAFFMPAHPGRVGRRLCLYHEPLASACRGAFVYVHPFAEEMNKSRRMAALQSRAFARAGFAVLQIDLLGCGDSSGEFGDATWDDWVVDVVLAARWLQLRHAGQPQWLWGLRSGCLLAAEAMRQLDTPYNLLFWQPTTAGKVQLQQFLRLKVADQMLSGDAKHAMHALRATLAEGHAVEVSGYRLSAALAQALERASLHTQLSLARGARLVWLEVTSRAPAEVLPASGHMLERWRSATYEVEAFAVTGPAFWQAQEVEDAPSLIDATMLSIAHEAAGR